MPTAAATSSTTVGNSLVDVSSNSDLDVILGNANGVRIRLDGYNNGEAEDELGINVGEGMTVLPSYIVDSIDIQASSRRQLTQAVTFKKFNANGNTLFYTQQPIVDLNQQQNVLYGIKTGEFYINGINKFKTTILAGETTNIYFNMLSKKDSKKDKTDSKKEKTDKLGLDSLQGTTVKITSQTATITTQSSL